MKCISCDGTGKVEVEGCCEQLSAQGKCCKMVGWYEIPCPDCNGTGEEDDL